MRKIWIASSITAMALADVCVAQSSTEATRWLIPNPVEWDAEAPAPVAVSVHNIGLEQARVAILPFKDGRSIAPLTPVRVVGRGNIARTKVSVPCDFILVIADKPVVATGVALRRTQSTQGQSGQIVGGLSNGGNGDFRGYMQPFNYFYTQSVIAAPIDCGNAPAAHFACSMTFEGNSSASPAGDVRVRPDARGQAAQPADRIN